MLFQIPRLDSDDQRVLAEIAELRSELRFQVASPRRWLGQLRRSLVADAIQSSNSIEGFTISRLDAEALVAGEEMPGRPSEEARRAVEGYRDALTYVQQAANFTEFSYHPMLFSALHFMMLREELGQGPGAYRTGGIWVTGGRGEPPVYTGPDPELIPVLMRELCDWLNDGDSDAPVLVRAAMAHLNLVSIHPWRDGNGRMSRCVQTLVLAREQILAPEFSSIEEWLGAGETNTLKYYAALREVRTAYEPERDAHPWIRFCLRAHHLQAQMVQKRLHWATRLWDELAALAEASGLEERAVAALYAATRDDLRRPTYQQDEALTRDQAMRDVHELKRLGWVREVGRGRAQRYVAAGPVREVSGRIHAEAVADHPREPYPP